MTSLIDGKKHFEERVTEIQHNEEIKMDTGDTRHNDNTVIEGVPFN